MKLAMYPILAFMYAHLAMTAEAEMLARLGGEYAAYANGTPRFLPKLGILRRSVHHRSSTKGDSP